MQPTHITEFDLLHPKSNDLTVNLILKDPPQDVLFNA